MNDYQVIRHEAGVVDMSDWGRFALRGVGAQDALDALMGANMLDLYDGVATNTLIVSKSGGVEAVVWVVGLVDGFMVVCEREDAQTVGALLREQAQLYGVDVEDLQQSRFALTLAGPAAQAVAERVFGDEVHSIAFLGALELSSARVLAVRLGFVGEYELHFFGAPAEKEALLQSLVGAGAKSVGASAYPVMMVEMRTLSRHRDIPADVSVFESGLQWMVDFRKDNFRGKQELEARRAGVQCKCVMVLVEGAPDGVSGAPLQVNDMCIGQVHRAYWSNTLEKTVALCYMDAELAWPGIAMTVNGAQARSVGAPAFLTQSVMQAFS
ncbi:aminomethyl transferase family protein [Verminephrobacter aporrectodeae subsp. tuberculatae]|uniref:glycine cleavage T C-terminal barrel domain-containing protein n=1 Tax=Verminephrobacter aporrectodeae TaxID=1110389 RepID=UPI000237826A|nr:glycine cleavage T C-terminal barrel domain-containing protein [Verminephrobacter aporrectodeae]MCW8166673.1 aminomethyl transferase family protein [Verminephrobacter aporrectodeae subsp. tuberculatae]MCW8170899.1 aminomethyl transferase family protein [Verminephrobacter aporrectodeae subsp. tuberculatae]